MIWLASFPRSGNTFVRNILYEVFGVESSTFDLENGVLLEPDYLAYPVVKTHRLPSQLIPDDPTVKAVYLVRDGRDALVSMAHHRSDIIAPGSLFQENLLAAIHAEKGSFFGGWSRNVLQWIQRADLIIRYEDLVKDPAGCAERIRLLAGLPEGDYSKIPQFKALKYGLPQYGSGRGRLPSEKEQHSLAEKNFRRGISGGWMDEMAPAVHDLFWSIHGEAMLKMGYTYEGGCQPVTDRDLDWEVMNRMERIQLETPVQEKYRVLVEADKLTSPVNDGVKRYQTLLLKELLHVHHNPSGRWHFDLIVHGQTLPVSECELLICGHFTSDEKPAGSSRDGLVLPWSVVLQRAILKTIPLRWKEFLVQKNILVFHRIFDLWWQGVHRISVASGHGRKVFSKWIRKWRFLFSPSESEIGGTPEGSYHLAHLPLQQHYALFSRTSIPIIATLHDFTHRIFPGFHTPQNIRNAERGWKFVQAKAARMIAVSSSCASDAQKFAGDKCPPLEIIPEAVDRSRFFFRINSDERHRICEQYGIPASTPFFLTLSSIEPRKNLESVIQAFFQMVSKDTSMQVNLVVAGVQRWGSFHPGTLAGFDPERVIFTGFVDDEHLPELYSEALGFCYVSHYEGFGLPLLEALNCGTPVIYGNNSSMPEVAGDAGLAADAGDPKDIALQMGKLFYDENLRDSLRQAALRQAAGFSPRLMARKTLDAYERTILLAQKNKV